jgi:hypothetical protein
VEVDSQQDHLGDSKTTHDYADPLQEDLFVDHGLLTTTCPLVDLVDYIQRI